MKKLIVSILTLAFFTGSTIAATPENTVLTKEELSKTIREGLTWMLNAQEDDGHFLYEYSPFWDRYTADDNIVRQAGAFFVIGEIAKKDINKTYSLKSSLEKSADYFEKQSLSSEFNKRKFKCLAREGKTCTLGGTSLTLIGLLDLVQAYPSSANKYEDLIENYKNYLIAMKKNDEGFRDAFTVGKKPSTKESSFSNGEAYLALIRYYEYNPEEEVKTVIEDSFGYFEEIYRQQWDANFYLWGMAGLKDWYKIFPEDKHYNFVKDYTDWRISEQEVNKNSTHNRCAYIEGVTSAYSVLEDKANTTDKQKYLDEINFWLKKSRTLQLNKSNFVRISFSNSELQILRPKNSEKALGGFLTSPSEPFQRIDFTQHCISSYLQKLTDIDKQTL